MFCIKDPSTINEPWVVSPPHDRKTISVQKDVVRNLKRQDILAINFLYQTYGVKQCNGAILNEESDMNMQIQVTTFLGALRQVLKEQFLIFVLTPDQLINKWHYHLVNHGGFNVKIITSQDLPRDFINQTGLALLLNFSNINLAKTFAECDYFSVIIDNFDTVATKMVIKKLQGDFNIGLTSRNFYLEPDQKLFWTMLNWCNPGCVGKLADFYEIDDDNFANFRNSYKHWWFQLTWSFCDSFVQPTNEELERYSKTIKEWVESKNLNVIPTSSSNKRKTKRKSKKSNSRDVDTTQNDESYGKQNESIRETIIYKAKKGTSLKKIQYKNVLPRMPEIKKDNVIINKEDDSDSSNDTVIYDLQEHEIQDTNNHANEETLSFVSKSSDGDTDEILLSLVKGDVKRRRIDKNVSSACYSDEDSDEILKSFASQSKKEILKDDCPSVFNQSFKSQSDGFLESLCGSSQNKVNLKENDVKRILSEADEILLK